MSTEGSSGRGISETLTSQSKERICRKIIRIQSNSDQLTEGQNKTFRGSILKFIKRLR